MYASVLNRALRNNVIHFIHTILFYEKLFSKSDRECILFY